VAHLEHPRWWIEQVRLAWPEQADELLQADDARAPLWLRNNARRGTRAALQQAFADAGLVCHVHPDLPDALRVDPPRPVELLPGFSEGRLSVQDAAAQRVVECLQPGPGMRVLDACAAPGGKTAHLLERCPELALLVALDVDAERLTLVQQTLERLRLGAADIAPTRLQLKVADARLQPGWWDGQPFDRILIDAPCSGSGVARRHPDIKWLRRESDLAAMARTQGELLDSLWPLLGRGGQLLYTTCSIFPQENETVIAAFLQRQPEAESVALPTRAPQRLLHGAQRLTGVDNEDGFYYALLRRRSD
jgi:16S rRNA (cytosine967-C5)-methyltransferase